MDPAPGSLDELRALQRLATLNSRQAVPPRHDYRPHEAGQFDKDAQAAAKAVPDEQTQRLSQYWCAYPPLIRRVPCSAGVEARLVSHRIAEH